MWHRSQAFVRDLLVSLTAPELGGSNGKSKQ
jgi:hypothetical protein